LGSISQVQDTTIGRTSGERWAQPPKGNTPSTISGVKLSGKKDRGKVEYRHSIFPLSFFYARTRAKDGEMGKEEAKRNMELTVKDAAQSELGKLSFPKDTALRIDVVMSGDCGCAFSVQLAVDELRKNDTLIYQNSIPFCIDLLTKRNLGDVLTLDYDPALGFALSSPDELFSDRLQVRSS